MAVRCLQAKRLFRGRLFDFVQKRFQYPDGYRATYEVVKHPGAIAIVPLFADGSVLLVKQFRPAVGQELYEIPAGTLDRRGETPLHCAQRELAEETGYTAARWEKLAEFFIAPGYSSEKIHLYRATRLKPKRFTWDRDERVRPVRLSRQRILDMLSRGKIRDGKTLAALWLAWRRKAMKP